MLRPLRERQYLALEQLIQGYSRSRQETTAVLLWFLRQTNRLSHTCSVIIPNDELVGGESLADIVYKAFDRCQRGGDSVFLFTLLKLSGSPMMITVETISTGCRMSCVDRRYERRSNVRQLIFSRSEIDAVAHARVL